MAPWWVFTRVPSADLLSLALQGFHFLFPAATAGPILQAQVLGPRCASEAPLSAGLTEGSHREKRQTRARVRRRWRRQKPSQAKVVFGETSLSLESTSSRATERAVSFKGKGLGSERVRER